MEKLLAQIIGILAIITITISVHFKKKNHMMLVQSLAHLFYCTQYILLGAYSAAYMDGVAIARNLIYYKFDETKTKIPIIFPILLCTIIIIIGYFNYDGLLSLIPIVITLAYTISATFKNPKIFKCTFGFCALIWLYYNYKCGAYVCIIGNVMEFSSTAIALIKERKRKKKYFF
ncbi:MAG: YgjV family protein [Bacilli bacterium]|nr:YgjV family protein [Bacilli bacterium]